MRRIRENVDTALCLYAPVQRPQLRCRLDTRNARTARHRAQRGEVSRVYEIPPEQQLKGWSRAKKEALIMRRFELVSLFARRRPKHD